MDQREVSQLQYRREIDGLRAVAVLSVILFHAGFDTFRGGYIGVDIFFVISGYLIAAIILTDLRNGTFSLLGFYERRIRRILPALFVVLGCTTIAGWFWLFPAQFTDFAVNLIAAAFSLSNFVFWRRDSYFGPAAELDPMIHTWSLGVEGQYYLLFPLFVLCLWRRFRRALLPMVVLGAVGSLLVSEYASSSHPRANFYLLPMRVWEFLVGALISFGVFREAFCLSRPAREVLSLAGIAALVFAILVFDENTRFPGFSALLPVAGAALIIAFAGPDTTAYRLLSMPPLVGIGLVSYSAFLWHQPLFAFARIRLLNEPSTYVYLTLIGLTFFLAYVSWRLVERPFRNRQLFPARKMWCGVSGAATVCLVIGLIGYIGNGLPSRFSPEAAALASQGQEEEYPTGCAMRGEEWLTRRCSLGDANTHSVSVALLGDSHAGMLARALSEQLVRRRQRGIQLVSPGCPPVPGLYRSDRAGTADCANYNELVLDLLVSNPGIRTVVIAARWTLYLEGARFDNGEGGVEPGSRVSVVPVDGDAGPRRNSRSHTKEQIGRLYQGAISRILRSGKKVILIYPVPEIGWNASLYVAKQMQFKGEVTLRDTAYDRFWDRNLYTRYFLDGIDAGDRLTRVFPEQSLCDVVEGRCRFMIDDVLLYSDTDHLNLNGARLLVKEIAKHL